MAFLTNPTKKRHSRMVSKTFLRPLLNLAIDPDQKKSKKIRKTKSPPSKMKNEISSFQIFSGKKFFLPT